ncbi:MAG: hypothetical protein J6386_03115 [Candidatus Synoicihabitans palmerolidicus]|nr:hypothetical protein [Candidatus Synoicihabitans palmerolidicus]
MNRLPSIFAVWSELSRVGFVLTVALFVAGTSSRGAERFPKPDPAGQFPDWKIYDEQGRPWRSASEDWVGARERVRQDAVWAKWLEQERDEVAAWMAEPRDRVGWEAGWWHDGVSPTTGERLIWPDEIPGEQVDHFMTPSGEGVEITPKLHAWWVLQ